MEYLVDALESRGLRERFERAIRLNIDEIRARSHEDFHWMEIVEEVLYGTVYKEQKFLSRFGDALMCDKGMYRIRIDSRIEQIDNEQYLDTLFHEIAHVVDYVIRGTSNHDDTWKFLAFILGAAPQAKSASSPELHKARTKYVWGCTNCGNEIRFARKKKRPIDCYTSGCCGAKLVDLNKQQEAA